MSDDEVQHAKRILERHGITYDDPEVVKAKKIISDFIKSNKILKIENCDRYEVMAISVAGKSVHHNDLKKSRLIIPYEKINFLLLEEKYNLSESFRINDIRISVTANHSGIFIFNFNFFDEIEKTLELHYLI